MLLDIFNLFIYYYVSLLDVLDVVRCMLDDVRCTSNIVRCIRLLDVMLDDVRYVYV